MNENGPLLMFLTVYGGIVLFALTAVVFDRITRRRHTGSGTRAHCHRSNRPTSS